MIGFINNSVFNLSYYYYKLTVITSNLILKFILLATFMNFN